MTVSMQITKRTYQGNGVTTQWDVDFPLLAAADVRVYLTSPEGVETELTDGYTVDLPTHTLTYPTAESGLAPLSEGWSLTVLRRTPMTQDIDLIRQGELDAEVLESGYDKLTLLVQELNEKMERSVKYPASAPVSDSETEAFLNALNIQRQQAQAAASQAELSAQQAQASAGAAQTAQEETDSLLQQAQTAKTAAQTAQAGAQAAQTAAETAKTAAQSAQTQAAGAADEAADSAAEAGASSALAQNWAVKTNGAVSGGEYSAKYHAQQAASSASAAGTAKTAAETAKTAAQTAQSAAETAKTQAASSASAAAGSAASASQSVQTCQELVSSVGNPAAKDLSNVTSISASSAVQTALNAKASKDLSNGTKATQANINNIMPNAMDYVVDSYSDDEGNWYRVYRSGWVEEGGKTAPLAGGNALEVTFLKPVAASYINVRPIGAYSPSTQATNVLNEVTELSFKLYSGTIGTVPFYWYACGQGAE